MNSKIQKIKKVRLFLLEQIAGLSADQLNAVRVMSNNNIIWNIAHLIAAQQSLCYVRAGLSITVDDAYFVPFLPATKPERMIDEPEIAAIKELFISSIDRLQADFDEQKFVNYSPSKWVATKYGVDVMNIDDALDFLLYHEGYHCGYILALRHLI